jgi:tetratricopeptide (TPR) repeat protein
MKITIAFIFFLIHVHFVNAQGSYIDSLLQKIAVEKDDAKRFDLIIDIFSPEFEDDPNLIVQTGWKLLQLAQENQDMISEAVAYSFFGHGYRLGGNNVKGLNYHLKALQLAEKCGNQSVLALVKTQMAHIYKDREASGKALQLYMEAEAHALKGFNGIMKIWPLMNAGATYLNANRLDSALICLQGAYEQSLSIKYEGQLAYILTNLGGVQSKLGNGALAVTYYHMAIAQALKNKSGRYENLAYTGLAEHYNSVQQSDSCIWYSRKAVDVVEHTLFSYLSLKPARMLTEMYQFTNCDSTLKYAKLVKVANDSLYNKRNNQQLLLLTVDEELRQHEMTLEKEAEEEKRQQNIQYALLAIGIITLITLFLVLSHRFITNIKFIHYFSVVAMLMVFEFLNLVLHPFLSNITNHTPALMLLGLVCIAGVLVPLHHRLEKWAIEKLVEKNKQVRLEMARKTIEELGGDQEVKSEE